MVELNSDPQRASSMPVCVTMIGNSGYLNIFQFSDREVDHATDHVMLNPSQIRALKQYLAENDL